MRGRLDVRDRLVVVLGAGELVAVVPLVVVVPVVALVVPPLVVAVLLREVGGADGAAILACAEIKRSGE